MSPRTALSAAYAHSILAANVPRMRPLALVAPVDDLAHLIRAPDEAQTVEIALVDPLVGEHPLAKPLQQPVPLAAAQQDHGKVANRPGLDQRQRLEELVQGSEAAGRDHERAGVAHEHDLAREEVVEAQADVDVGVELLLVRKLD